MGAFLRLNAAIVRVSPIAMLFTYMLFSFSVYTMISTEAFNIVWYVFISVQTLCAFCATALAINSKGPSVIARRQRRKMLKEGYKDVKEGQWPCIDVVLLAPPHISPSDRFEQVQYILQDVDYPQDRLQVYVVYAGKAINGTQEISQLGAAHRNVHVVEAVNAMTEADSLNHYLSLREPRSEITSVYGVRQVPQPDALRFVARRFLKGDVDVLNGRRCFSNRRPSIVSRFAGAELDAYYGLLHPGRGSKSGHGLFWGSNAHWATALLQMLGQRENEIDTSLRALLSGARCVYDLNAVSFEPAPLGLASYIRQAQLLWHHWTRTSSHYAFESWRRGAFGSFWTSHLELPAILSLGALYHHLLTQLVCSMIASLVQHHPNGWPRLYKVELGFRISVWLIATNLICIAISAALLLRNRSVTTPKAAVVAFMLLSPLYIVWNSWMAIISQLRAAIESHASFTATHLVS